MHMRYTDCVALVFTDTHIYMELERQSNTHVKRFIYKEKTRNNNKLISLYFYISRYSYAASSTRTFIAQGHVHISNHISNHVIFLDSEKTIQVKNWSNPSPTIGDLKVDIGGRYQSIIIITHWHYFTGSSFLSNWILSSNIF